VDTLINIKGFNEIFKLAGVEGQSSIYLGPGGNLFIKGKIYFQIILKGNIHQSLPIDVGENRISIREISGSYWLVRAVNLLGNFFFPNIITLNKNEISPSIFFNEIYLNYDQIIHISFEQITVSVIPIIDASRIGKRLFYYDRLNNPVMLRPLGHPISQRNGFYVFQEGEEIFIKMGLPLESTAFNDFDNISLVIAGYSFIMFSLLDFSLTFQSGSTENQIIFNENAGWDLKEDDILPGQTVLNIAKLISKDGWIFSEASPAEKLQETVITQKKSIPGPIQTNATKILTEKSRLTFYYPLPIINHDIRSELDPVPFNNKVFLDFPQFVYEDKSIDDTDSVVTVKNQFYGIRVSGLNNNKNVPSKLDADIAVLRFEPTDKKLYLYAGSFDSSDEIKVLGKRVPSKLIAKKDTIERILKIPCGNSNIVIRSDLNSQTKLFKIRAPELETSPLGPGSLLQTQDKNFDKVNWLYSDVSGSTILNLNIQGDNIFPENKQWLLNFKINPDTSDFELLGNQITRIIYDVSAIKLDSIESVVKTVITSKTVNQGEKEKLVYAAYGGALALAAAYMTGIKICDTASPTQIYKCIREDLIKINIDKIDDSDINWIRNNNLNNLIVYIYDLDEKLKKFIDDNFINPGDIHNKDDVIIFWPVWKFIGIPLYIKKKNRQVVDKYCYQIIKERDPKLKVGFGMDLSLDDNLRLPESFGFTNETFRTITNSELYKNLFPSYNNYINGKLDPTGNSFIGFVFRNMPLMLDVPHEFKEKLAFVNKFLDSINEKLLLDLGWRTDEGFTWIAKIDAEIELLPGNPLLIFNISNVKTTGQFGKFLNFTFDIHLGFLKLNSFSRRKIL
jgi:hypothetical protein